MARRCVHTAVHTWGFKGSVPRCATQALGLQFVYPCSPMSQDSCAEVLVMDLVCGGVVCKWTIRSAQIFPALKYIFVVQH